VVNHVTCSASVQSSILYVHACHPRGALSAHWACRMLSGPWGIVVVLASWPGHPTLIKKKEKTVSQTSVARKKSLRLAYFDDRSRLHNLRYTTTKLIFYIRLFFYSVPQFYIFIMIISLIIFVKKITKFNIYFLMQLQEQ
jgi:hypothetical protein